MNNKHVFWQSLIIALVIFWSGIILGVIFEQWRADKLQEYYVDSETNIFDVMLQQRLLSDKNLSCDRAVEENIEFADKIYSEARDLEKYDSATKITDDILKLHRRYDMLRALLWNNLIELEERCPGRVNTIVYLYDYEDTPLDKQARQITMSKVLLDLKKKYPDKIVLIPIAADTKISSLGFLMERYNVKNIPAVLINEEHLINDLASVGDLEKYLDF